MDINVADIVKSEVLEVTKDTTTVNNTIKYDIDTSGFLSVNNQGVVFKEVFNRKSTSITSDIYSVGVGRKIIVRAYNLGLTYKKPFFLEPDYTLVMPVNYAVFEAECLKYIGILASLSAQATTAIVAKLPKSLGFIGNIIIWVNNTLLKFKSFEEKALKAILKFVWDAINIISTVLDKTLFEVMGSIYDVIIASRLGDFLFAMFNTTKWKSKYVVTGNDVVRYITSDECSCNTDVCKSIETLPKPYDDTPIIAGQLPLVNFFLDYDCASAEITYPGDYRFHLNTTDALQKVIVTILDVPLEMNTGRGVTANKRLGYKNFQPMY